MATMLHRAMFSFATIASLIGAAAAAGSFRLVDKTNGIVKAELEHRGVYNLNLGPKPDLRIEYVPDEGVFPRANNVGSVKFKLDLQDQEGGYILGAFRGCDGSRPFELGVGNKLVATDTSDTDSSVRNEVGFPLDGSTFRVGARVFKRSGCPTGGWKQRGRWNDRQGLGAFLLRDRILVSINNTYVPVLCNERSLPDGGIISNSYDMCLDLHNIPPEDEEVFLTAKALWTSNIVGDVPDVNPVDANITLSPCGYGWPNVVDDLHVCAEYVDFDGPGRILGGATAIYVRESDGLPFSGLINLDVSDVNLMRIRAPEVLTKLIQHELAHTLGVGSRWYDLGVVGPDEEDCPYLGEKANQVWQEHSGCSGPVPTELDGRVGTRCGHFDECLGTEMMTGYPQNAPDVFSTLTVATLEDMGYEVVYDFAQPIPPDTCGCDGGHSSRQRGLQANDFSADAASEESSTTDTPPPRTTVSPQARALAEVYGRAVLKKNHELAEAHLDKEVLKRQGIKYVGDQFINVLVQDENGVIDGVQVANPL